ncbi:MAG: prolyl oligopeptidase family serine peptidase [Anaerolineae bacterium]|nr:prolyl oligopeptidase family serine peptidase [Anaerolineae bacterium]
MKHRFVLLTVIGLFLLPLFVLPLAAQDGPAPVGLRPDAPTYAVHGPYWVGTQTFVIEDADDPMDVRVWYPALNPNSTPEAITYVMHWNQWIFDGFDSSMNSDIAGHALADAQADIDAAPYPLVVFSHGGGSESVLYAWLVEHLASYGFVVIAPNHREILDASFSDFARSTIVRAQSIPRVLDYAAALTASTSSMAGMIDMERVAIAGQSYGGYTALVAAGARYDMVGYGERCAALAPDDPNQFLCFLIPSQEEMAQFAELDSIPQELWPAMGDSRIDALITIAGDSYMFDKKGLAEITIPVLAIGGTRDTMTLYDWGVRPTYDNVASQQKILASFEGADHYMALESCADAPSIAENLGLYFLCSDPVWDMNRAHDLINYFTTAFLLDELKGDVDAHAALAPDAVNFPGITYEAQGF